MGDHGIIGITRIWTIVIKETIEVVVAEEAEEVEDMMETAVIEEEIVAIVAGAVEAEAITGTIRIGDNRMREFRLANARKLKELRQQQRHSRIRSCFLRKTKLTS